MRKNILAVVFMAICPVLFAQQTMNNDSVIKLVKAGLSDDLIISTINASPGTYDTSANGLIALKTAGASDKVISSIVVKASGITVALPPTTAATALPAGIQDVGVYYKNKGGVWTPLLPEIVNFKTGGVMKSVFSAGIVKGDINGHIAGPHARFSATFPLMFAVYVPEGTEITEYQLLRLHNNQDSREFRSVTGGVYHLSGGATRDMVQYEPTKIADRVYTITMDSNLGKGDYGLLPPGSYNTSNLGSSGKIYTVNMTE